MNKQKQNGIVYMVQPSALVGGTFDCNHQRIKIGRSKSIKRINKYNNGTIIFFVYGTNDMVGYENEIKKIFKNRFKLVSGTETFEGSLADMKKCFLQFITTKENNINTE